MSYEQLLDPVLTS